MTEEQGFLNGESVGEIITQRLKMSEEDVVSYFLDLCTNIEKPEARTAIERFVYAIYPNQLYDAVIPGETLLTDGTVNWNDTGYLDGRQFVEIRTCGKPAKKMEASLESVVVNRKMTKKNLPAAIAKKISVRYKRNDSDGQEAGAGDEKLEVRFNQQELDQIDLRRGGLHRVRFTIHDRACVDSDTALAEGELSLVVLPRREAKWNIPPVKLEVPEINAKGASELEKLPFFVYDWTVYIRKPAVEGSTSILAEEDSAL